MCMWSCISLPFSISFSSFFQQLLDNKITIQITTKIVLFQSFVTFCIARKQTLDFEKEVTSPFDITLKPHASEGLIKDKLICYNTKNNKDFILYIWGHYMKPFTS